MRTHVVALAAVLVLAACGDNTSTKTDKQETPAPAQPAETAASATPAAMTPKAEGDAPGLFHHYGQNCFGMDAPLALGLLGVRGGKAEMEPASGGIVACRFLNTDGKVVARVVAFPSMALTETPHQTDVAAMTALMSAVSRNQPTEYGPSKSGVLRGQGQIANVPLTMFQSGWGTQPKGEIGWLGGSAVVYVQFFGPSASQAKLFVEMQAVKATPGT